MKNLANFVLEGRRKKEETVDIEDVSGKKPDTYGNASVDWSVDEPEEDDVTDTIDLNSDDNTESTEDLIDKFDAEEDFFIVGKAGWGKTSMIKSLAKKYKRHVITVYLDKAVASDLGGIPVPVKGKSGAVQEMAMPSWAKIMEDNPDKKFLLFFDEMNQAAPDVMNALIQIVLEHEICGRKFGPKDSRGKVKESNFFVGAAGNFESENDAVNELSGPLKSRFKPLITWETGTARAWKATFNHLHKIWDNKLGKEFVDKFQENANIFENPREIEHKIFKFVEDVKKNPDTKNRARVEKCLRRLKGLVKEDMTRSEIQQMNDLAETMFSAIKADKKEQKASGRSANKDREMLSQDLKNIIEQAMTLGYFVDTNENIKYGISKQNLKYVVDLSEINAEMLDRYLNKLEADGKKFKYETDEDFLKDKNAKLVDPLEEEKKNGEIKY